MGLYWFHQKSPFLQFVKISPFQQFWRGQPSYFWSNCFEMSLFWKFKKWACIDLIKNAFLDGLFWNLGISPFLNIYKWLNHFSHFWPFYNEMGLFQNLWKWAYIEFIRNFQFLFEFQNKPILAIQNESIS